MKDFDVHNINRKLELAVKNIESSQISKQNKETILKFQDYGFSIGLSKKRILKYLYTLHKIAQWLEVSLENASKEDIMKLVRKIEQGDYSEWTKHDYKVVIKRFYKWIDGDEIYPDKVRWIKTSFRKNKTKLPEGLITKEEVEKMIRAAEHIRDKALVALFYESGFRTEEILTLRIKHIMIDEYGAKITGTGKTGMRRIRLISSVPYLAAWIESHPFRDRPEAPLWVKIGSTDEDEIIHYNNARRIIKTLAKKANIKKRIYPHLFRHSRATHLANKFTESQLDQYFGWVQGSIMPSTYVHLSGRDLDGKIFEINGLKEEKKKEKEEPTVKKCYRCEKMNPSTGKFCGRCGSPLDVDTAMKIEDKREELDNLMNRLMKDPEVQSLIARKLEQIKVESQSN